ncbi:MAG TPA: hypothetical protein P5522_09585 [Spirochaetia bacterium]|nr:hypothetical protein [Spirochaetia bacterium]
MAQSYTHTGEYIRGGHLGSLVKSRPLATAALSSAYAGRIVSIDSSGNFQLGNGGDVTVMPLMLLGGIESPAVYSEAADNDWVPARTGDTAVAAVMTGGFELQSTEFDSDETYAPNTYLTADANGILTPVSSVAGSWVVGICSVYENQENNQPVPTQLPVGRNANGRYVVTFWSYFLPGVDLAGG